VRVIFIVLAVAAALRVLYALTGVLLLIVFSIFFAYLIAPLVEFACRPVAVRGRRRALPRPLAIGIVYLLIFGALGLGGSLLIPRLGAQLGQFAEQAPAHLESARARALGWTSSYERYELPAAVRDAIDHGVTRTTDLAWRYATEGAGSALVHMFGYLPWLILIPILALFLLRDSASFRASALQLLPAGSWRGQGRDLLQDLNRTLALYIRGQLIACLVIGAVCTIGFSLIGLRYPLLLGVVAGLLEFIPLVGPLAVAVIAVLIAGFVSVQQVVVVALFLGILRIVQDYVIYPRIIGHGIHLHPLVVIVAVLCGAELAGVAGIFLAIPTAAIMSVGYRHWLRRRRQDGFTEPGTSR
jgi:predicted PurR-regulated permease PerM